jgi:hypothetical protein
MRRTGTNAQVAHVWAQDNDYPEMRSKSMRMYGDSIYSYNALIGRFVTSPRGNRIALLSSNQWSVTTSSHQSEVWSAVHHKTIFKVPNLQNDSGSVEVNVNFFLREITDALNKSIKSRKNARWNLERAERLITKLQEYVHEFEYTPEFNLPMDLLDKAAKHAHIAEERLKQYENESEEDREKRLGPGRVRRERLKKEKAAAKQRNLEIQYAKEIEYFRSGNSHSIPYWYGRHALLRLKPGDPTTVQTSRGAEFPLCDAKLVFSLLLRYAQMSDYNYTHGSSNNFSLGPFRVDSFKDGIITAGCHTVEWSEAVRFMETIK